LVKTQQSDSYVKCFALIHFPINYIVNIYFYLNIFNKILLMDFRFAKVVFFLFMKFIAQ